MSKPFKLTVEEFTLQVKLSCRVPALVNEILTRKIIAASAQQANLPVEPVELQQAADRLRSQNNLWTAEETWTWLQKHGLSLDNFEAMALHDLLSAKLAQHLFGQTVEPFFAQHQLDYVQVVLSEVVLDNHDLALELFYAIQEQEMSFATVAQQYSSEPDRRRQGGYRGILRRADLRPEISAAVFAAQPPALLKPIVINKKSYLMYVEEIIQPVLDDHLRSQILGELFEDWLKRQVREAIETVKVEF
jgi:parvulin-like peptidyl-prolyl isomerase